MDSPPLTLEYASRGAFYRRRWFRLGVVLFAIALATPIIWYRQDAILAVRKWYWQRQCMNWTAPADQILFSDVPADAERLGALAGYHPAAMPVRLSIGYAPPPLLFRRRLSSYLVMFGSSPENTVFLHARRAGGAAKPQLLIISVLPNSFDEVTYTRYALYTGIEQFRPATTPVGTVYTLHDLFVSRKSLRLYAGQPDPNDESAFSIGYELDGVKGTLKGRLNANSQVTFDPL